MYCGIVTRTAKERKENRCLSRVYHANTVNNYQKTRRGHPSDQNSLQCTTLIFLYTTTSWPFIHRSTQYNLIALATTALVDAAAPVDTAPVPVSVLLRVSLLFWPIGWNSSWGILLIKLSVKTFLPATIGPTIRARKRTSKMKYKIPYLQTRLFRSFDCFIE